MEHNNREKYCKCRICGKIFDKDAFFIHIRNHQKKCESCDDTFATWKELEDHQASCPQLDMKCTTNAKFREMNKQTARQKQNRDYRVTKRNSHASSTCNMQLVHVRNHTNALATPHSTFNSVCPSKIHLSLPVNASPPKMAQILPTVRSTTVQALPSPSTGVESSTLEQLTARSLTLCQIQDIQDAKVKIKKRRFKCKYCDKRFQTYTHVSQHLKQHLFL